MRPVIHVCRGVELTSPTWRMSTVSLGGVSLPLEISSHCGPAAGSTSRWAMCAWTYGQTGQQVGVSYPSQLLQLCCVERDRRALGAAAALLASA